MTGGSEVSPGISYIIFFGVPIAMLIYPFMINKVLNSKGNRGTSFNSKDTIIISENESNLLKNESVKQERIPEEQNIHTKVSVPTVSSYTKKATVNKRVIEVLDDAAISWGVKVLRYEIKDLTPPEKILQSMQRQITAEREKRAVIAESEVIFIVLWKIKMHFKVKTA